VCGQTIGWTTVNFEIEELRKLVVETTLYLVTVCVCVCACVCV
jgi:hypothetical protein